MNNYLNVTETARQKLPELEAAGYLHSDYSRFKEITKYDKLLYNGLIESLGTKIIKKQILRENEIYNQLNINGVKELNEMFNTDEAINNFIDNSFNDIYSTISDAMSEVMGDSNLNNNISKKNKKDIEKQIEKKFDKELENMTSQYKTNFEKIVDNGIVSKNTINSFKKINNRTEKNKIKTGKQIAKSALASWKGNLLEYCVGLFASQLNNIKGVEITGGNTDNLGKFIKSDITAYTDSISIGFSAKNYKTITSKRTGEIKLANNLTLHSGGDFKNFLKRLENIKNNELQSSINLISKGFKSDNYYYNLINEAANKPTFKSSNPAQDFIKVVKELAAVWFGTQLLINTSEQVKGQNVDFLVVSNIGIIPISSLLMALREQTASLKVNIESKADIDTEYFYNKKINSYYNPEIGYYSDYVKNIGYYSGQEVYDGIEVSKIKLSLVLSQLI